MAPLAKKKTARGELFEYMIFIIKQSRLTLPEKKQNQLQLHA
jgi:hypothetical protein